MAISELQASKIRVGNAIQSVSPLTGSTVLVEIKEGQVNNLEIKPVSDLNDLTLELPEITCRGTVLRIFLLDNNITNLVWSFGGSNSMVGSPLTSMQNGMLKKIMYFGNNEWRRI